MLWLGTRSVLLADLSTTLLLVCAAIFLILASSMLAVLNVIYDNPQFIAGGYQGHSTCLSAFLVIVVKQTIFRWTIWHVEINLLWMAANKLQVANLDSLLDKLSICAKCGLYAFHLVTSAKFATWFHNLIEVHPQQEYKPKAHPRMLDMCFRLIFKKNLHSAAPLAL